LSLDDLAVARHVIVWRKVLGTRIRRGDWLNLAYTSTRRSNSALRIISYPRTPSFRSRSRKQSNFTHSLQALPRF